MILLDTNIVIDMINNSSDSHWNFLAEDNVCLCGIVVAELYRGVRNKKEHKAVQLITDGLDIIPVLEADWKEIGLFIASLNKEGISVPFQDAVIAFLAIRNKCTLISCDKHFKLIKMIKPELLLGV